MLTTEQKHQVKEHWEAGLKSHQIARQLGLLHEYVHAYVKELRTQELIHEDNG
jgi:hypothetical protein